MSRLRAEWWKIVSVLLFCCLFCGFITQGFGLASFDVAPGVIHFDLNKISTQTILLRNSGDELIHVRLSPVFFPVHSRSLRAGTSLNLAEESKTSLVPYLLISPQVLSLQPGESRYARVSIHAPEQLPGGSYRVHILARMLEIYRHVTTQNQMSKVGMHLNLLMEIAVAVYGDKGKGRAKLQAICSWGRLGRQVRVQLHNATRWNFSGIVRLYTSNPATHAKPVSQADVIVFRESQQWLHQVSLRHKVATLWVQWVSRGGRVTGAQLCHIKS